MKRGITLFVFGSALVAMMAMPAGAQGRKLHVTLTCGGATYEVQVPGNGNGGVWQPALDDNSNLAFHPTAFGEISGTFIPSDGGEPQTLTNPPHEFQAQAQQHNEHPTVECGLWFATDDPEGTFEGSGSVSGWISGH